MANLSNTVTQSRIRAMLLGAGINPTPLQVRTALNMDPDLLLERLNHRISEREATMPGNGTPKGR